ncbi:CGNR zinc finger domain-containing protein [Allomesorhizobium alhagi]|uniref:Zinc finger CGNR domain-containing protein n=1 Tax=Mesorhizobium alhagi CCNWXJ12-2 TaxID=1107882 RepID=H0HY14_9HYPH|nr:ABATE domain-containing protein [Mesorhizobium alhagi]EHK54380.1 hypothetical protein MAXJ12_25463 [Mesorhizobium alhagi CCNWXJ12-2]
MQIVPHDFVARDLVGGHVVLDFVNTVTARDTRMPRDWFDGYGRLLDWAGLAGLFDEATLASLRGISASFPERAAAALDRAKRLREALHRIVSARIVGVEVPAAEIRVLESIWKEAVARTRFRSECGHIGPSLDSDQSGLDLIADSLAMAAVDLLGELPAGRSRICSGAQCGWIFIDKSKGGRRIWCDMATCGNAAKSRRHYHRRRDLGA